MNLSKSRYCQGLQCPKILWMNENKGDEFDDGVLNEGILNTGNEIGDLAMGYFGEFTEIPYNADKSCMLADTEKGLAEGCKVLCEASFSHNGNFCSVDILRIVKDGVEVVEVKSSTEIKPVYIDDMAFQYHVLLGCGFGIKKISLMHINKRYVRQGSLDLKEFFTIEDCTAEVLAKQSDIENQIGALKKTGEQQSEPDMDIGPHCTDPYECGYKGYCWKHIPEKSVFTIAGLRSNKAFDLYHRGIITLQQVQENAVSLTAKQRRQLESELKGLPPSIEAEEIRAFLDTLSFPLYFLDFETFMPAIPSFDGCRPYMQIPFQYSLHILSSPTAEAAHHEFLAKEGTDPRRPLAEALCKDIPVNVCTLAYNMGFEKGVIANLAEQFTDLSEQLLNIRSNIKDLMTPFRSQAYYRREFEGYYSIKTVLPGLFPDDPELNYHNLNLIQNGGDAMAAFLGLEKKSQEEIAATRQALLSYCCLDTLAMVKIWEYLNELV
jgi:hypothetical protein